MTPLELLNSLSEELREAVKHFKLSAQYQPDKKVSVYVQSVPVEQFEDQSFYPLIAVELLGVEDDVEFSTANILITIGTYNGENTPNGDIEHLNLLEQVRQFILTHHIIGKKFLSILPVYSAMVERNSADFTYSNIFIQYQMPNLSRNYIEY